MKLCTVCGVVTSGPGSRCPAHAPGPTRSHPNPLYGSRAWRRISKRVLAAHVGEHGWWCPGDGPEHAPHPSPSLTVDHIVTLSAGGAPLDRANLRVLCRSRNSELGARTGNALRAGWMQRDRDRIAMQGGGVASGRARGTGERAARLCSLGRVSRIIPVADRGSGEVRPWAPTLAHVAR